MALGPQAPAPGPQVLLEFMEFLQQSMLPELLLHCFCEDSCFEINSMVEKFNFVSPTLSYNKEPLTRKTELRATETFVNKIISYVDPCKNHDP